MNNLDISTEEKFLENREALVNLISAAFRNAMIEIGDDINGIPWFNPRWKEYLDSKYKAAA